jgi:hypothetical protein
MKMKKNMMFLLLQVVESFNWKRVNNEILGFANQDKFAGPDQFAEPIYAQPAIVNVQQNITQLPDFDHDSVFCKCPWCGHEVR